MKSIAFVVLFTFGFISLVRATDYCASALCPGSTHIACRNNGSFGSTCPASRQLVTITDALRQAILNSHNSKRNTIASGALPGFRAAVKMATVRWNDELAELAALNAKRCIYGHDQCHNTDRFQYSGQNIAKTWWSAGSPTDTTIILRLIDAWWDEYKDATMADILSYPANPSKVIGHFTVMTSDRSPAVGCAAIRYPDASYNNWNSLTLVCNYAKTNVVGRLMYMPGIVAKQCSTGTNPNFPAVCSGIEPYNVNVL